MTGQHEWMRHVLWWLGGGLALLAAVAYPLSCWWFPYKHCRCCKGSGRHYRADGRVLRLCRWCGGSGRWLRVGRWLWDRVQARRSR